MKSQRQPWRRTVAMATALSISAVTLWLRSPSSEELLSSARKELARGHYAQAEELAVKAMQTWNPSPWAALVAAAAAVKSHRPEVALGYYEKVPTANGEASLYGLFGAAEMHCHLGHLSEGERRLRELLRRDPHNERAHFRLAFVLNITGRRFEAAPHLLELVRTGAATIEHLLLLGLTDRMVEDQALLDQCRVAAPDDPLPLLGDARRALSLNENISARGTLAQVRRQIPNLPEAEVRWGYLLLETDSSDEFMEWSRGVSAAVAVHPETWLLRGRNARQHHEIPVAARCFWEALRRDPTSRTAHYQLGRVLEDMGNREVAASLLDRAELLQQLAIVLDDLFYHRDHTELMRRACEMTELLGRFWEAHSWALLAHAADQSLDWPRPVIQRLRPMLRADLPQVDPRANLSLTIDLSNQPLPSWSTSTPPMTASSRGRSDAQSAIQFAEIAASVGIDFRYFNSADPKTAGARIFETTGGGVGVLDYDADGWPDLYFTQGTDKPALTTPRSPVPRDQMFRNVQGARFENVTAASELGDADFSQGVTSGDFDNDGFADLYVANFGQNRLFHNQGDGTFRDVTLAAGVVADQWTTSVLMADLNGDSWPDLYDVNYCAGPDVATRICQKQGQSRSCSPRAFAAATDQVWLSQGDGRFRNVTATCGIDVPTGYGLGVIAADFAGDGKLSLFVANDEVANFYFLNRTSDASQPLKFSEQALASGLAFDADGAAQACMGVAAGDVSGDGRLDLFVTNFYNESNTLYLQQPHSSFVDSTRSARLREPSFSMLGFGAQFLDADLDGWLDLIVTNGHIDDLTSVGQPYKMPPQFFRNQGHGRFDELPARALGPFFETQSLGRGLARLDWNRDGREDVAISHIDGPAALLENRTDSPGNFLTIQLRGRNGSRDAIGAVVEVQVAGRRIVCQLIAGDGYQASNHRQITIGLGSAEQAEQLSVRWLGGATQTWKSVASGNEWLIREGDLDPISLRRGTYVPKSLSSKRTKN